MVAVRTSDFDYDLPPELIAQDPAPQRDLSRLLVLSRAGGPLAHRQFMDLPGYLRPGDVLVLNDSRVVPARLRGANASTGGEFEILLLEENTGNDWWCMMRPGKRARIGTHIVLKRPSIPSQAVGSSAPKLAPSPRSCPTGPRHGGPGPAAGVIPSQPAIGMEPGVPEILARVVETNDEGHRRLVFSGVPELKDVLDQLGEVPLPPYIERAAPNLRADDRERYQTVYARPGGSVAAPTAGLHFTESLLAQIRALGVEVCSLTLHVGLGTFAPVKAQCLSDHRMHEERFHVGPEVAERVNAARLEGRRIIAVGTTTVRVLESVAAEHDGRLVPGTGRTRIFIHPPSSFWLVNALLTNFHLPCSTLLMLVSAFAAPGQVQGRDLILSAYREAVRQRYRFFSYGDAMLIL
jgi:S-adenosylmethionine:tRNA ribosyltransferase-isomerase